MNLILAILAWVAMALVIGTGMLLAVKGSLWLLVLSILGFIFLVAKFGCLPQKH